MAAKKSNDSQHRLSPEPAWTPIHPFPTIFHLSNPRKCPSTSFEPSSPLDPPNPQVTGTFTKHSPIHFNSSNSMGSSSKEALIIETREWGRRWCFLRGVQERTGQQEGAPRGWQREAKGVWGGFNLPTSLNALVILSPYHTTSSQNLLQPPRAIYKRIGPS